MSELAAEVVKNNLRTWCRSDGNQSQNLVPKHWKSISELGAEALKINLRTWCRSDEKQSWDFPAKYLRNFTGENSRDISNLPSGIDSPCFTLVKRFSACSGSMESSRDVLKSS
jgi:Asp-tRNA(Asn)/Glu-tRNA(Gln) amidotransferase C subunit